MKLASITMKLICASALLLVILHAGGCSTYKAYYDIGLSSVERSAGAGEKYGDFDITKVDEKGPDISFFEDELVDIVWTPTDTDVFFELTNKADFPIKILWENAAFIDEDGERHRMVHSGVDFADVDKPQPTVTVKKNTKVSDTVFPAGNFYYVSSKLHKKPLYPNKSLSRKGDKLEEEVSTYVGKTFEILLPLEIEGDVNEYLFKFRVLGVEVK